jgi:hypothetical protein
MPLVLNLEIACRTMNQALEARRQLSPGCSAAEPVGNNKKEREAPEGRHMFYFPQHHMTKGFYPTCLPNFPKPLIK